MKYLIEVLERLKFVFSTKIQNYEKEMNYLVCILQELFTGTYGLLLVMDSYLQN